ncbi:uncharacterized protein L201_000710 [Kwoniella dendrophila CBS 6074]|uniref:ubiquitinyl hydrolase 1 n=1 Tax=Kwoniella dendrophila CBS 6074 TaxID=1295534 RepID=A0AAX4JN55_9TREE
MSTPSALPPPLNGSQPPTPYQPSNDPSTSPSISNNPPPQPPPTMPTFASINSSSSPYPSSASSSGPSSYSPHLQNNQYMYNQHQHQQHQQQPYYSPQAPRHAPQQQHNVPYNSSAPHPYNRYQDQSSYSHQPHLVNAHYNPPIYNHHHQAQYNGYPIIPPVNGGGGGGPGPATMQNGYGGVGYGNETYQHIPYGVYPQHLHQQQHRYPVPQDTYQQYPNGSLPENNDHLQQPNFSAHEQNLNGGPHHIQQQSQPFHHNYPPNHPYAYGVGVGFPGYQQQQQQQHHQQHMNYGGGGPAGFGGYQEGYIPPNSIPNGNGNRGFGKGLNPTAAGFSYSSASASASASGSRANSQPSSTPIPNGDSTPSSSIPDQIPQTTPAIIATPKEEQSSSLSIPNGHTTDNKDNQAEVTESTKDKTEESEVVDKQTTINTENEAVSASQSETPISSSAPSENPNISGPTTIATESTAATTVSSPISAQTPKASETELPATTSPRSAPQQSGLTFIGETLAGITSPVIGTGSRTVSNPSALSSNSSSNGRKRALTSSSTSSAPLILSVSKPDYKSEKYNTYSSSLKFTIPETFKLEETKSGEKQIFQSKKGSKEASRKKAVYAFGDDTKKASRPKASKEAQKLVFGEIDPSKQEIPAAKSETTKTDTTAEPAPTTSEAKPLTAAYTEAPAPTLPVKAKPFSWASLVRGPSASSSSSTATPSKLPSPAKSTISLPGAENEAGPSRLQVTEPPTQQNGDATPAIPVVEKKKVPFNYAAAAAVGATMSPQEELAKLLSEGVKGKGKENAQATLPRGLINTGNMCFANTILQVLVYCSPFTELFEELGKRLKADLARKTPLLEAMIIFLREFNAPFPAPSAPVPTGPPGSGTSTPKGKGKDPRREAFIPENVYDAMKENKRFDSMRRGHQEDAEEYLGFFLNTLHEELLYVLSRTQISRSVSSKSIPNGDDSEHRQIERPVSPGAGDDSGWLEVGKKQKTHVIRATESKESAISRLFGGTIRSLLRTPGSKDSVTLEPYQPLQLDIQSSNVLSIEDALKHLTEPEIVPGVYSQTKKTEVDATKQIHIETFPQVWILHLKRFVYDPKEYNVVKKNKLIAYNQELIVPPEIISPGRRGAGAIKYRLFGVVYHHGVSASGGHYTVAVSRQDGGGWIHFDDENVTNIPKEDVIVSKEEAESGKIGLIGGRERTAYLLFYQRVR